MTDTQVRELAHGDYTPAGGLDPLNLVVSISSIIHHADSLAVRRRVMSAVRFPAEDVPMFLVVNQLSYHGAMRPSDVADMLNTSRANLTKITHRLVGLGLVVRHPDPHDARSALLALTTEGREIGERIIAHNQRFLDELLADWSEEEVATLKRMLARLARQWSAPPLLRSQAALPARLIAGK
ncbi:MarR family winged helix-turn-helix transcriptional regulator [Arthrobacter sp. D2-10]